MDSARRLTDENIRVLFIENDPAVAEMYKLKLELDGYEVTIVSSGHKVLENAVALRPDLVFLDIRRAGGDGLDVLRALRNAEVTRHLPVIILSNQPSQEMAGLGFTADVMDYVVRADATLTSLTRDIDEWARLERG